MEWSINKGARACSTCERRFEEGEEYLSVLFEDAGGFLRKDYCIACWDGGECFSFWRTRVPTREQKRKLLADDSVLMNFFQRLEGQGETQRVNFRYLLALILMRKKLLKFDDIVREDGDEYLVLREWRGERQYRVLNPQLSDEQVDVVKEDLTEILDLEL